MAGQPPFFWYDVGKLSNTSLGITDLDLFDYERALGVKFTSSGAEPRPDWRERNDTHGGNQRCLP